MKNTTYIEDGMEKKLHTSNKLGWFMLVCAWFFYLYEYILRASPGVITNELMNDFGVTSSALGILTSFYYLAYVPLQIPCGMIVDRLGARRVITFSCLLCVFGCIIFTNSHHIAMAQVGRFLMGAGSACAYIGCAKVAAEWFSPSYFPIITGFGMFIGTLGGSFGGMPFAMMANTWGWRNAMNFFVCVGVVIAILTFTVIRDRPQQKNKPQSVSVSHKFFEGLRIIATNPQAWLIGLYGCMMYLPLSAFAELWGTPFMMKKYDLSNDQAVLFSTLVLIGMGIGSVISPVISNAIQSRIKVMSWSCLGTAGIFSIIFFMPDVPIHYMYGLCFLGGVVNGGQILYFSACKEIAPIDHSATAIGFTNGFVTLSGLVFQPLLGFLLDLFATSHQDPLSTKITYTLHDYQLSFVAVIVALGVGWLLLKNVKETYVDS